MVQGSKAIKWQFPQVYPQWICLASLPSGKYMGFDPVDDTGYFWKQFSAL
jgi:hypothetical protein